METIDAIATELKDATIIYDEAVKDIGAFVDRAERLKRNLETEKERNFCGPDGRPSLPSFCLLNGIEEILKKAKEAHARLVSVHQQFRAQGLSVSLQ